MGQTQDIHNIESVIKYINRMSKVREKKEDQEIRDSKKAGSGKRWRNKITVPRSPKLRSSQRAKSSRRSHKSKQRNKMAKLKNDGDLSLSKITFD